ncbi:MAG TPA: M13 family metallopeptidase N-terminal domain-containing protein, partial [Verrucomicrobiae bacterium]|nr:M13 family metallopeptidase N-terminal domain-containing protein [Verrucomicrobiae bacterium]
MIRLFGAALTAALVLLFPFSLASQPPRNAASQESGLQGCFGFVSEGAGGSPTTEDASAQHGFNLANLDRSVSPCDNFYEFADGGWMKNNPIPPDRASWATFDKLRDHNDSLLHGILEEASKDTK